MAHFDDRPAGRQTFAALTDLTDVKGDMVSIFGSDQQREQTSTDQVEAVPPRRRRNTAIDVSLLGAAGLMLAAGVFAGNSVLNPVASGMSKSDDLYSAAEFRPSGRRQEAVVAPRGLPAPAAAAAPGPETGASPATVAPVLPHSEPPVHAPASRAAIADVADTETKRVAVVAPRRVPIPVSTTASVDASRAAAAEDRRPPSNPSPVGRSNCSTLEECADPLLRSDDQDVADAYQQATVAGVRPKTLREYRAEWIRARRLSSRRPAEAAKIYQMIGSDLRLLAADPAIE